MRTVYYILGALVALYTLVSLDKRKNAGSGTGYASSGNKTQEQIDRETVTALAHDNWGIAVNWGPNQVTKADQNRYPGWYKTPDGGWVKPSTGEIVSPGGSPPIGPVNRYDLPESDPEHLHRPGFTGLGIMEEATASTGEIPVDSKTNFIA